MPPRTPRLRGARPGRSSAGADPSLLSPEHAARSAYATGLRMLASREMSEARLRDRLAARGYLVDAIEHAASRLRSVGALDDERAVRACARTLVLVKRRGRLRARRELEHMGFRPAAVSAVLDEILDARAERVLLEHTVSRQVRGRNANLGEPAVFRRVQGALVRRGFSPSPVRAALLARLKGHVPEEIDAEPPVEDE